MMPIITGQRPNEIRRAGYRTTVPAATVSGVVAMAPALLACAFASFTWQGAQAQEQEDHHPSIVASSTEGLIDPRNSSSGVRTPSMRPTASGGVTLANESILFQCSQSSTGGSIGLAFNFSSPTGTTVEKNWIVRIQGIDSQVFPPTRNLMVDLPITIKQDMKFQRVVRNVPHWAITRRLHVQVFEAGSDKALFSTELDLKPDQTADIPVKLLTGRVVGLYGNNDLLNSSVAFRDEIRLDAMLLTDELRRSPREQLLAQALFTASENQVITKPVSTLPSDWRGYQSLDMLVADRMLLSRLHQQPGVISAIRQWVMLGGTLVVVDPANQPDETSSGDPAPAGDAALAKVMNRLGLGYSTTSTLEEKITTAVNLLKGIGQQRHDHAMNLIARAKRNAVAEAQTGTTTQVSWSPKLRYEWDPTQSSLENANRLEEEVQQLRPVLTRTAEQWNRRISGWQFGSGFVVRVASQPEVAMSDFWVIQTLLDRRVSPMLRRGVDPMIGDKRFSDWLVPGVAQPPVYTFMGLLLVFVVLVGPVCYRWTARHRRTHLMFLIAPVLAGVTTTLMFAYSIFSDGFDTLARVRQVTVVDAATGTGVERVRGTYFSGLRVAGGLQFGGGDEVTAYPRSKGIGWVDHQQQQPQTLGRVTVGEKTQRFDSSFLPARQQVQFVVHRGRPGLGALSLQLDRSSTPAQPGRQPQPDGQSSAQQATLKNTFDFSLQRIVLCTGDQEYWTADSIQPGMTARCVAVPRIEATKLMGKLYNDFRPVEKSTSSSRRVAGQFVDPLREVSNFFPQPALGFDGLLESNLRANLQTRGELPIGHFVAISDVSDDAIAVDSARLCDSVRYVTGTFLGQAAP